MVMDWVEFNWTCHYKSNNIITSVIVYYEYDDLSRVYREYRSHITNIDYILLTIFIYGSAKRPDEKKKVH